MKNKFALAALIAITATPAVLPTAALAQDYRDQGSRTYRDSRDQDSRTYRDSNNQDSRAYRDSRTYRGRGGNYRHRCDGGNGAVGTIAGGAGGALIGNAVGGGTLGTIAGGLGGGLLGRHLDKQHTRDRRGC